MQTQTTPAAATILERAQLVGEAVADLLRWNLTDLARATKGATLAEQGHARRSPTEAGTWLVTSARDPRTVYSVRRGLDCTCWDNRNGGHYCKHLAAVQIVDYVAEELRWRALVARPPLQTRQPCRSQAMGVAA